MSANMRSMAGWLSFRRIADVPFQTCVAALESWQRTGLDGDLRIGGSRLRGPIKRDRDTGTCRIGVRLARGPLRPLPCMRLDIDRWSSSSTAFELIPCGRVRPTAAYFRAGHLLLDSLNSAVPQCLPPAHARGNREPATSGHAGNRIVLSPRGRPAAEPVAVRMGAAAGWAAARPRGSGRWRASPARGLRRGAGRT